MNRTILLSFLFLFIGHSINARTFYVKKSGNDAFSGLSIVNAWQSIAKVNSIDFNANDTLLFEGGSIFNGNIYLSEEDSATASQPLFISSYGIGRATIFAGKSFGVYAYNVGGVQIHNLNFEGLHPDSSTNTGVYFYTDNSTGKKYKHIWLSNLNISGFKNGIHLGSYHINYPGYSDIKMTNLYVFNNLQDGLNTYDIANNSLSQYAHDSLYMSHCYFNNNGFSGVVLGGIQEGIIEYVKASRSGQLHNKGVVGIWAWSSKNLTFQYCIADSTRTDGGDGGGFDLDGGTENCVVQYCYSFFNDGPGYMHCDYPKARATKNNTIRYNISEYDGQQAYRDKSSLIFISWGSGLQNCLMYNNTGVIGNKPNGLISGLQGYILDGYDTAPKIYRCKAFNNIVYANGDSNNLLRIYNGSKFNIDTTALQFGYNVYFASKPTSQKWRIDNSIFYSLNDWRSISKQEIYGAKNVGWTNNPQIKNPGLGAAIPFSKIDSLPYLLNAYTLLKSSPIIDSGLNIKAAMGADIGKSDFFKNAPLSGFSQDIGCHETQFVSHIFEIDKEQLGFKLYPNPCSKSFFIETDTKNIPLLYTLMDIEGRIILNGVVLQNKQEIEVSNLNTGIYLLKLMGIGQKTILIQK